MLFLFSKPEFEYMLHLRLTLLRSGGIGHSSVHLLEYLSYTAVEMLP